MTRRSFAHGVVGTLGYAAVAAGCMEEQPSLSAGETDAQRWADDTLAGLTLREKVAQMVCEQMRGDYTATDSSDYAYWSELVSDYGVGGFVVYGGTPHDTASLLNRLQSLSKVPLLISSDFEGGPGQQFAGASEFPANMAFSAAGSEDLAFRAGKAGALEGRAIGVHVTYSPVVDVQTRPDNPVLSVRSFGKDVELLGRMASAYIRGYQENGMLATAKHFPGRGDVDLFGDTEFLINRKDVPEFENEDMAAFQKAVDAGVTFVMSEHIAVPSATFGSEFPASVEEQLATGWLRERLGFTGILTTDDLWYPKVVERFGAEQAGVLAIQAGHDALLKPANAIAMIEAVAAAVEADEIAMARIDDAVGKLLYWKARLGLHLERSVDLDRIPSIVGTRDHRELVQEIAERSITVVRNDGFFPTRANALGSITHVSFQKNEHDDAPVEVARKLETTLPIVETYLVRPGMDPARFDHAVRSAEISDTLVISLFNQRTVYRDNGQLRPPERELLRRLVAAQPKAVAMSYGNPYVIESVPERMAFVVGYGEGGFYGNQIVYADTFIRLMKGEIEASGKLPVDLTASA